MSDISRDPWARLRAATPARIGLGRVGVGVPTVETLQFQYAHARARDAVHRPLDVAAIEAELAPLPVIQARSAAPDRATYLRRPDLGRRLGEWDAPTGPGCDVAFVLADGLSAQAVQSQGVSVLSACIRRMKGVETGPITVVTQARVAIGDEIGQHLRARLVVVLIGERPGLTVADSLGVYLTFDPRPGCPDSARNCVSNIHGQGGLTPDQAADRIVWLARSALRLGLTGTGLKENAGAGLLD